MSELSNKLNAILKDIEQHIQNPEDLKYVKEQINNVANIFITEIEDITENYESRMKKIEEAQTLLDNKMLKLTKSVDEIEKDIYETDEDENFDFQIVCPYCNYEFVTDSIDNIKNEIKCPECNNIIELDWNMDEEEGCSGSCSHCQGCGNEEEQDEENNEDDDM